MYWILMPQLRPQNSSMQTMMISQKTQSLRDVQGELDTQAISAIDQEKPIPVLLKSDRMSRVVLRNPLSPPNLNCR